MKPLYNSAPSFNPTEQRSRMKSTSKFATRALVAVAAVATVSLALVGCAGLDSYTAAKGGVTSLVRSFAAGVGRDGVRVNAIAPSFVSTEPQRVWLDDDKALSTIQSLHILPVPTPEQIAPFVVYLASDESVAVTGTVFPIDAGYMAFKAQVDVMGTMQAGY